MKEPNWVKREGGWGIVLISAVMIGIVVAYAFISLCAVLGGCL